MKERTELERDFDPYLKHFEQEVLPHMMTSNVVVAILTDGIDSKICLEIGAAVLLDKPLLILTTAATLVPERLRRIADRIMVVGDKGTWKSEEAHARILQAISEIMQSLSVPRTAWHPSERYRGPDSSEAANREGFSGFDERKDFQK